MSRRKSRHETGIPRLKEVSHHDAWAFYTCVKCKSFNVEHIGRDFPSEKQALKNFVWECKHCGYLHSVDSDLPFGHWPEEYCKPESLHAFRFWRAFFRSAVEKKQSFWKQCGTCGRILPNYEFSKHSGKSWRPLNKQMECRSCKAAINTVLNPKRTRQQLHEASLKRRVADALFNQETREEEENKVNINDLFERFDSKCFKTKKELDKEDRSSWEIDHILPSKYLYPLTPSNAALLSKAANQDKSDKWPSEFYTNTALVKLSQITGAPLNLLASDEPKLNPDIDVNAMVKQYLKVREHSDLQKRIKELKVVLESYNLLENLSDNNKKRLGY